MARRFCRPLSAAPTRYLFVGNCGPNVGLDIPSIQSLFADYGPVEVDITEPAKSYVFVTFPNAPSATEAMRYFKEVETSRGFVMHYADVKAPRGPVDSHPYMKSVEGDAEECGIAGLQLLKEFITEEEEHRLLQSCHIIDWEMHSGRRTAHFGIRFDYAVSLKQASFSHEHWLEWAVQLDQLTVNGYPPGIGLAMHIDTHSAFTGAIVSLSTGSAAIMQFRKGDEKHRLLLPRRSLLIMNSEARYCWQHGIPPNRVERESVERVSFTFRQARGYPCLCAFPSYCDSQLGALPPTRQFMEQIGGDVAMESCQTMEQEHVHDVYNVIARHFSSTRFAVWPKVRSFLETLPKYSILVDVGCGNGKYFNIRSDLVVLGFDRSPDLLKTAIDRHYPSGKTKNRSHADVAIADGLHLPLRDASADAVLCVAVLHHVSSIDRRLQILKELVRILRPQGHALITVWAQEQEDPVKTVAKWKPIPHQDDPEHVREILDGKHGMDYFVPWHLPLHRAEGPRTADDAKNAVNNGMVNEDKRSVVFNRYYHVYVKGELEQLCSHLDHIRIAESFYDKSNWCVILQKLI